jgi:hypothetical protein
VVKSYEELGRTKKQLDIVVQSSENQCAVDVHGRRRWERERKRAEKSVVGGSLYTLGYEARGTHF